MKAGKLLIQYSILLLILVSCGEDEKHTQKKITPPPPKPTVKPISRPSFSADSAYSFVKKQVDFGPRVPNTPAHKECAKYLAGKLRSYDLNVIEQKGVVVAFNDERLKIINIIGQYKPELKDRILLFAHWDSRPFADRDTENQNTPIDGANDGASGVGVLVELARQLMTLQPEVGIDIIFFDAEDYGQPINSMIRKQDTWCLGTQYWTKHLHVPNYSASYGILLDMVGAKGAIFPKEGTSRTYAPDVQDKVWNVAKRLGYGNLFVDKQAGETIDDHVYVNKNLGIPSISIVHYNPAAGDFFPHHHRHGDSIDKIDRTVLQAVGEVVLATINQHPL